MLYYLPFCQCPVLFKTPNIASRLLVTLLEPSRYKSSTNQSRVAPLKVSYNSRRTLCPDGCFKKDHYPRYQYISSWDGMTSGGLSTAQG